MKTETVQIVDLGRGPQLSNSRITVLDIFYYLHRGHDFDFIHQAIPNVSREEFDLVLNYITVHRDELVEQDRRAEEFIKKGIAEQKAKGLHREIDESVPLEDRISRLKKKMHDRAEDNRNGDAPH